MLDGPIDFRADPFRRDRLRRQDHQKPGTTLQPSLDRPAPLVRRDDPLVRIPRSPALLRQKREDDLDDKVPVLAGMADEDIGHRCVS